MQPNSEPSTEPTPSENLAVNLSPPKKVSDFLPPQNSPETLPEQAPAIGEFLPATDDTQAPQELEDTVETTDGAVESEQDLQLFRELKDDRDKLRGVREERDLKKTQRILKVVGVSTAAVLLLSIIGFTIFKSLNKPAEILQHQAFVLPADLSSKPADEQAAINVINLARKGDHEQIITKWLGSKDLSSSKEDFKSLILSYESSADGNKAELIEKKVGKTNLGVEEAEEVNAVSIIFKSGYFEHPNNLYTKLNLYEPLTAPGTWKLYAFEFKAQDDNQPLKADLAL